MQPKPTELILKASQALRLASTYGPDASTPELVETHISWVYLVDDFVYKLLKPVKYDFLDYSSSQRRHQACVEAVRINRRLAPDVYLGVVPIGRSESGDWHIGQIAAQDRRDDGQAVEDWLIKMKRLPEQGCFANRITAETWTGEDVDRIVHMLSRFYQSARPIGQGDYVERVSQHARGNYEELRSPDHELDIVRVEASHASQMQYLFLYSDELQRRESGQHLVDGHGDLRADHVYLTDPPVCIDGIEFSRELRLVDVADELCFFAITCEVLGAPAAGMRVLREVCEQLGDDPPESILNFYLAYRASVRAKVAALQADQRVGNGQLTAQIRSKQFLELTDKYAYKLGPPRALIVRGLSGTGKTTFAARAAELLGAHRLSTDGMRAEVDLPPNSEKYDDDSRQQVYDAMLGQAAQKVTLGLSVILDGTFLKSSQLQTSFERLRVCGADVGVATCICPRTIALQRIRSRISHGKGQSDANADVYAWQEREVEAVPSGLPAIELDTTQNSEQMFNQLRHLFVSQADR